MTARCYILCAATGVLCVCMGMLVMFGIANPADKERAVIAAGLGITGSAVLFIESLLAAGRRVA